MVFFSTREHRALATLLAAGLLAGCGSQMDSIDDVDVRDPSPLAAGIYPGVLAFSDRTRPVTTLIDARRIYVFDADGDYIAGGLYTLTSSVLSWNALAFVEVAVEPVPPDPDEPVDPDAEEPPTTAIEKRTIIGAGPVSSKSNFQLTLTSAPGGTGQVSGTYSKAAYERRSDLSLVAGTWGIFDISGQYTTRIEIGQSGELSGTDLENDCSYSGRLALIHQFYNLYTVPELKIQCGTTTTTARTELGLATLRLEPDNKTSLVIVTNGLNSASLLQLQK